MKSKVMQFGEQLFANLYCKPQNLVELFHACLEGKNTQVLAEIVLQDTALAAKVLQAACKTCPKQLNATEPVVSAIDQLGLPALTGIALQAAKQIVGKSFSDVELRFLNRLWYASQVAGQTARCLAPTVSYPNVEEAQLCGLLLNLGLYAQFANDGVDYAVLAEEGCSSIALRQREEATGCPSHHLQLAEKLIEAWRLDSFLVDAISFLHVDIAQIENSDPLLKIARLARQICQNSDQLSEETRQLAERLFNFRKSEIDYLFDWAHGLYQGQAPALDDVEQLRQELVRGQRQLANLTFVLADLEGIRARLLRCSCPEDLAGEARNLYLESSAVSEAVFLLIDQKNSQLNGIAAAGQARLIAELKVPLEAAASLATLALLDGEQKSSFEARQPLTVIDRQLQRLCRSAGICCLPLRCNGRLLGVVVLGVDSAAAAEGLQNLRLGMFGQVISSALVQITDEIQDRFVEGSSLIRRVSNELSNPLTIIGNYAEVLGHSLEDPEKSELTESIKKEIRRIDDVLNYYVNRQEMPFFPGDSIDLNQLVLEAVEALQPTVLEPRGIDVRYALKDDLPEAATNAVLVKQVLVNLIKNAAEAIEKNGLVTLSTRETYCADGGRLAEIVVHDNGPGIVPELRGKLFRPVLSTKGIGHAGVGLSVVKSMVDDLQGRISCHSSETDGTSFHLQIPYGKERDPMASA